MKGLRKLAVVASHPIQYYAPWFQYLAADGKVELRVFYLWDFGVTSQRDAGFGRVVRWDVPLMGGYASEFVPNVSRRPGTERFFGLRNPTLARRVLEWKPDAVLVFGYGHATQLRFLLTWPRRIAPILFRGDSHLLGRGRPRLRNQIHSRIVRYILGRCGAMLATGIANRSFFLAHGVPPKHIFTVPHCVDNARFSNDLSGTRARAQAWRKELGIAGSRRVVLFAGKLEIKKRPDLLLNSFLDADLSNTTLLFVGHGPLEGELRARAAGRPEVVFAPFQNQAAMPRTYAAADLLVLPSQGSKETWGLSVNEAMATSVPAIVSDHVGCAMDLVREGETGWVFPAGDGAALTRSLQQALAILTSPSQREVIHRNIAVQIANYSYTSATAGLHLALTQVLPPAATLTGPPQS